MTAPETRKAIPASPPQPADLGPAAQSSPQGRPAPPTESDRLQVLHLGPGYLAILLLTELLAACTQVPAPYLGPALFAVVLLLLVLHATLCWDRPFRYLPLSLAFAPAGRLALLFLGPPELPAFWRALALAGPVLAASAFALRILHAPKDAPTIAAKQPLGKRVAAALSRGVGRTRSWVTAALSQGLGRTRSGLAGVGTGLEHALRRTLARLRRGAGNEGPPRLRGLALELGQGCRRVLARLAAGLSHCRDLLLSPRLHASLPFRRELSPRRDVHRPNRSRSCPRTRVLSLEPRALLRPPVVVRLQAVPVLFAAALGLTFAIAGSAWTTPLSDGFGRGGGSSPWIARGGGSTTIAAAGRPGEIAATGDQYGAARTDGPGAPAALESTADADDIHSLVQAVVQRRTEPVAGAVILSTGPLQPTPTPPPVETELPYCPTQGWGNPYPRGVCTWYAKEKRPDLPGFSGDYVLALNWPRAAELCGFRVDQVPAAGAVIVYPPGANGAWSGGHVGYVEQVGADYLLTSECNISHDSGWAVAPLWWEAGYECGFKHIPFSQLDPRVWYIHGREGASVSSEQTADTAASYTSTGRSRGIRQPAR